MKYYRIIEKIHEITPMGYGVGGGRWNIPGIPVIYACSSSALCFLEMLSIKGSIVTSTEWILITFEISEEIPYLESKNLPADWKKRPYPLSTQKFGSIWARDKVTPVLKVPSCRIPLSQFPEEHNLLINPLHPETEKLISIISIDKINFEVNN